MKQSMNAARLWQYREAQLAGRDFKKCSLLAAAPMV
jgi:hypothetical protein